MTLLPFKIDAKIKPKTHVVNDGLGHSLEVSKYGCLTVEETEIYHSFTLQTTKDENYPFANYKIELVFRLLCSRFKLPENTPRESIFIYPDDSPMGEPMIEAMYGFFENERMRWDSVKESQTEGKQGEKLTGEQSITS
jgi:hypothetical protein